MTALIKNTEGLSDARIVALRVGPAQRHPADIECDRLNREIDRLKKQIADLKADHVDALEACEVETEERVRAEIREDRERADAALEEACIEALTAFNKTLNQLADKAPVLAVEALRPLLANPEHRQDVIKATVAHQLAELKDTAVVEVRVSALDFDPDEARALAETVKGGARLSLDADPDFLSGEIRFSLKLGALELSLEDYWQRVRKALETACLSFHFYRFYCY